MSRHGGANSVPMQVTGGWDFIMGRRTLVGPQRFDNGVALTLPPRGVSGRGYVWLSRASLKISCEPLRPYQVAEIHPPPVIIDCMRVELLEAVLRHPRLVSRHVDAPGSRFD